jgi:SEC-C motif
MPQLFGGEGAATITMTNVSLGPCPVCGGFGKIPDGVYQYAARSIELLRTASTDVRQFENLRSILEVAQRDRYEPKRLAETIERETPVFAGLATLLPQSRTEIQNYILILISAISLILSFVALHPKDPVPSVTQIFNTISQQSKASETDGVAPGRNDPCPCGSGKKFKKCHGATAK